MAYVFSSILGVFIGAGWDIHQNHGYWIGVAVRGVQHGLQTVGLG